MEQNGQPVEHKEYSQSVLLSKALLAEDERPWPLPVVCGRCGVQLYSPAESAKHHCFQTLKKA